MNKDVYKRQDIIFKYVSILNYNQQVSRALWQQRQKQTFGLEDFLISLRSYHSDVHLSDQ